MITNPMNSLDQIETELKALLTEAKKKNTPVKDSIPDALSALAAFKNSHKDKLIQENFPIDEVLKPISQCPATRNAKLISQALSVVQRLLTHSCVPSRSLQPVMQFLIAIADIQEENLPIKLIQTVLLFVNPKNIDFTQIESIEMLFSLCLQLYGSKDLIIHNTSSAAISQLTTLIFEQYIGIVKEFDEEHPTNFNNNPIYVTCVKFFKELILLATGIKPTWFPHNFPTSKNIGLDLVNAILKQLGPYLKNSKDVINCLKKDLIPYLLGLFRQKGHDFIFTLRLLRAACRILISLQDGLDLLENILLLLNETEHDFERYLLLESLNLLCSQTQLIIVFNERHISANSFFLEILNHLLKVCKSLSAIPDNELKKVPVLNFKLQKILENDQTDVEIHSISPNLLWKTTLDCLSTITESYGVLCESNGIKLGNLFVSTEVTPMQVKIKEWIMKNWKVLLKCFKALFPKEMDEIMTQQILKSFQAWINITGTLQISQARDSILLTLCQGCLPTGDQNKEISIKNIQTCKILFNIAHGLGNLLDVNSWHTILTTLQKIDIYLKKLIAKAQSEKRNSKSANGPTMTSGDEDLSSVSMDVQILTSMLEALFEQSQYYPDAHLIAFLEALNQLSLDYMEKVTTAQNTLETTNSEGRNQLFGLTRMLDTIKVNLFRLDIFWDLAVAHFVCIANSKNQALRTYGVENLSQMIQNSFNYIATNRDEVLKETVEEEKPKLWQKTLFQPWVDICNSKFPETKETILLSVLKLLQSSGHDLDSNGWQAILTILHDASLENYGSNAVTAGFKCLEKIVNDYLPDLQLDVINSLLTVMENFQKVATDNNVSYSSVNMFWNIADLVTRNQSKEGAGKEQIYETIWTNLLEKLILLCNHELAELRHSAVHIFSSILVQHGSGIRLLDKIIEEYVGLSRSLSAPLETPKWGATKIEFGEHQGHGGGINDKPSPQRVALQKQWEETILIVIQNFTKITKKFLIAVESQKEEDQEKSMEVLKQILEKIRHIMYIGRNDIVIESLKFFHEFIIASPPTSAKMLPAIFQMIDVIKNWLQDVRQDSREIKMMVNRFIPEVLEILTDLFSPNKYKIVDPAQNPYEHHLFEILEKAIFYSKQAESFNAISPNKIMMDERTLYEFVEKIPVTFNLESPTFLDLYFNFLVGILGITILDRFTEIVVRKFMVIVHNLINNHIISEAKYLPYLPTILEKYQKLMRLRVNNEFLALVGTTSKSSPPIWLYATEIFLKLVSHTIASFKKTNENDDSNELSHDRAETQKKVVQQIVNVFGQVLSDSSKAAEQASKNIFNEIKNDWFDMDMRLINSISDIIIPHCYLLRYELLWKLISILEGAFTLYSKNPLFADHNLAIGNYSNSGTISKTSFEILFKISESFSQKEGGETENNLELSEQESKKLNLAKFATKKLLLKCKNMLATYITDERKSGSTLLPRNRITEVIYVLQKLKNLSIPLNSFELTDNFDENEEAKAESMIISTSSVDDEEFAKKYSTIKIKGDLNKTNALIQGRKGHLVFLFPLLAECIGSKEPDIKDILKDIFLEVSKAMGLESF